MLTSDDLTVEGTIATDAVDVDSPIVKGVDWGSIVGIILPPVSDKLVPKKAEIEAGAAL